MTKNRLFSIFVMGIFGLLPCHIAMAQPDVEVSRHLQKVQERGRVLPLDRVGSFGTADKIRVDGNLDEWGKWNRRSGLFLQDMDHLSYTVSENPTDAAGVKLLRDDDALYIGVRVLDDSIYNTKTEQEGYNWQDCVEVFLDVRPIIARSGYRLGDTRSSGFYQLLIVPPTPARPGSPAQPLKWGSSLEQAHYSQIGPIEIASNISPQGYDLEIRIPYSSLHNVTAERFDEAIGFDIYVDDTDLVGETANSLGRKTAAEVYSWGGLSIGAFDPGRLAAALADAPPAAGHVLRQIPAKLVTPRTLYATSIKDDVSSFPPTIVRAGILEPIGARLPDENITLSPEYSATIFDTKDPDEKPISSLSPLQTRLIPGLDAKLVFRDLTYEKLPGGRYTFSTSFDTSPEAVPNPAVTEPLKANAQPLSRFYANPWGTALSLRTIAPDFAGGNIALAFQESEVMVESINHFVSVGEPIAGQLGVAGSLGSGPLWTLSQQAQSAIQQNQEFPFVYRLNIYRDGEDAPVHTTDIPLRAFTTPFSLPATLLATGKYYLEIAAVDKRIIVPPNTPADRSGLDRLPLIIEEKRNATWPAQVSDAPRVWSQASDLGSPNRQRFPLDDTQHAPRRSVACLQLFENRLYVGSGIDYVRESTIPPGDGIDIWSISAAPLLPGAKPDWVLETSLNLNQVANFRVAENQLLVSSTRFFPRHTTIPLQAYAQGKWKALPELTGWQLNDILPYEGKLYASVQLYDGSTLLESNDGGTTWETKLLLNESRGPQVDQQAPLPGGLLLTSNMSERGAAFYSQGEVKKLPINLFPVYPTRIGTRTVALQAFNEGVVYTVSADVDNTPSRRPLYFLRDLDRGAVVIEPFANAVVQDIKVRDGLCYILTAEAENKTGEGFTAAVFSSPDLKQWTKRASATLPALPNALELTRDAFYIGLANRNATSADPASGSVWAITE